MTKYQEYFINLLTYELYVNGRIGKNSLKVSKDGLEITQDSDITISDYCLKVYINRNEHSNIKIEALKDSSWTALETYEITNKAFGFKMNFNFDDSISKIRIETENNLFEAIELPIKYIYADKEAYYEKVRIEEEKKAAAEVARKEAELEEKAQVKHSAGADLINIYFQPCCDDYNMTVIEFYLAKGVFDNRSYGSCVASPSPLQSATPQQMLAKFKIEDGMYFKSITGLANGVYGYYLSQLDSKGNVLFKTKFKYLVIR